MLLSSKAQWHTIYIYMSVVINEILLRPTHGTKKVKKHITFHYLQAYFLMLNTMTISKSKCYNKMQKINPVTIHINGEPFVIR
jgi:hypothetical protein